MGDHDEGRKGGGTSEVGQLFVFLGSSSPIDPLVTVSIADSPVAGEAAPPSPALPSIELIEVQIDELHKKLDKEWVAASSAVADRLRRPSLPKDFPKRTAS